MSISFSVYTWGWGIHGQLGQGDACDQYLPKALVLPESGDRVCEIAAGYAHTLLLTEKVRSPPCIRYET